MDAFLGQRRHRAADDPRRRPIGDDDDLGPLQPDRLNERLVDLHRFVFREQPVDVLLQLLGLEIQRVDDPRGALAHRPGGRKVLRGQLHPGQIVAELDRLHHLAEHPVGQHHDRVAVVVGLVERDLHEVGQLLQACGGIDQQAVVAIPAAPRRLEVVGLRGLYAAQPRSAAHDVDDDARQLGAGDVGDALLLERDPRRRRRGHHPGPAAAGPIDHVDGRDLTLGLDEHATDFGQLRRHVFRQLGLRGDRVAEERPAPGPDGCRPDDLVALHQRPRHRRAASRHRARGQRPRARRPHAQRRRARHPRGRSGPG